MLISAIDKIKTDSLEAHEIINIISIKKELTDASKIIGESQEKILGQYGIKPINDVYTWNNHEKSSEISSKIGDLFKQSSELKTNPVVSQLGFYSSIQGLNIIEIEELANILLTK